MSVEPGTADVILPDRTHDADYDAAGKSPKEIEHESDRRNLATLRGLINSRAHGRETVAAEARAADRF